MVHIPYFECTRAAESFAAAMNNFNGIAYSLKEYEDIAIKYARDNRRMRIWREEVEASRTTETLFDTKVTSYISFTRSLNITI